MSEQDDREAKQPQGQIGRDPAIERAWREASTEMPPPDVDARILAAARAVTDAEERSAAARAEPRRRNVLQRWQPFLAAAAVAGLAFVLVPMTLSPPPAERSSAPMGPPPPDSSGVSTAQEQESAMPQGPTADERVDASRTPQSGRLGSSQPAHEAAMPDVPTMKSTEARELDSRAPLAVPPPPPAVDAGVDRAGPPEASAPPPASSGTTRSLGEFSSQTSPRSRVERAEAAGAATESATAAAPAAPAPQAREKRADDATTMDAPARVARITMLHRNGDLASAAEELRALRAVDANADAYLPEPLRAWARTVQ